MLKKRILLSLVRRKSNWCIALILTVLTTLIFIGVLIWKASLWNIKELEKTYGSSLLMEAVRDENNEDFWDYRVYDNGISVKVYLGPRISLDMLERISREVAGVVNYEIPDGNLVVLYQVGYQLVEGMCIRACKAVEAGTIKEGDALYDSYLQFDQYLQYDTQALFAHNSEYLNQFRDGTLRLLSGRHIRPEDEHTAIVSAEFAELNNLKVGDKMPLMVSPLNSASTFDAGVLGVVEVEIVGFFEPTYEQSINEYTIERDIMDNWIITDIKTGSEMSMIGGWSGEFRYATLYVEEPSMTEEVMGQIEHLDWIDRNYYIVDKDDSVYQEAAAPLHTIKWIMLAGIGIVCAAGAALMYLVLMHGMRQREREAGILMALGVHKKTIKRQFLAENLILGGIALLLAAGIASASAPVLGDRMLHTLSPVEELRVYSAEEIEAAIAGGDYEAVENMTKAQKQGIEGPDTLNVHVDARSILITGVGMILLICLCVNEVLQKTLQWEPAKVLSMVR